MNIRLLFVLFCCLPVFPERLCAYPVPDIRFEHISVEHGLSQSGVRCILQDRKGFLWFGTWDGLNRFDGYGFRVYKNNPDDPASLSHNVINTILEDRQGIFWIGTGGGGLNRFDPEQQKFSRLHYDPDDPASLSHDGVNIIYEDMRGELWIGTQKGLNRFDPETESFVRYENLPDAPGTGEQNHITAICETGDGRFWIGSLRGLYRFDPETGEFVLYPDILRNPERNRIHSIHREETGILWIGREEGLLRLDEKNGHMIRYRNKADEPYSLSGDHVNTVFEDSAGRLWIGTDRGLNRFDREKEIFIRYQHDPRDPFSMSHNVVWSVFEDRSGMIWIGTYTGGLNKYNPGKEQFFHYKSHPDISHSLSHNNVWGMYEDSYGMVWIGSDAGLNRFDPEKKRFTRYSHDPDNPHSLRDDEVWSVCGERFRDLWVGTFGGLHRFDRESGKTVPYINPLGKSANKIKALHRDRQNILWCGTDDGLFQFDRKTEKFIPFRHFPDDPRSLSHNNVFTIYEDRSATLWVGTEKGLNRLDRGSAGFVHYHNIPGRSDSISSNWVISLCEDSAGFLWVGTVQGLNRLDRATGKFIRFREKDGLPNEMIYGILEDHHQNLWLSTNNGLSKFNPRTERFTNYSASDGLQSNEFNIAAYLKTLKGQMFFGGINGLTVFWPSGSRIAREPDMVFTDFRIFNESVAVAENSFLRKSVTYTDQIELSHKERVFSFEFAALHFADPSKNQYAYMMDGFDKDWIPSGTRRFATYTNLPPGDYRFRIKGAGRDGLWNEEGISLRIRIIPPFWQTLWFKLLASLFIMGSVLGFFHLRMRLIRMQKRHLEMQVRKRTHELSEKTEELAVSNERLKTAKEKADAANRSKSRFLANMSHEIRTPMNAILGFSEMLLNMVDESRQKKYLSAIHSSGKSLLCLINDILDLSKIEAGKLEIRPEPLDIQKMLEEIRMVFFHKCQEKELDLEIRMAENLPALLLLDEVRIRQILINLVGNAVKFTSAGYVRISASAGELKGNERKRMNLILEVEDTGMGIPEDQQALVFESFQQQSGQKIAEYGGTGLGLSITKQLTEIMGGGISVESRAGKGSIFRIIFYQVEISGYTQEISRPENMACSLEDIRTVFEKAEIMCIDDSAMNRELLKGYLDHTGISVIEAESGEYALHLLDTGCRPDLIITDLRMPGRDGYEITKIIRNHEKWKQIPVIVCTAAVMKEEEKSISAFFDGFLRKPLACSALMSELKKFIPHQAGKAGTENAVHTKKTGADISEEAKARLPELIGILEEKFVPVWEECRDAFFIDDIERFSAELIKTAKKYNIPPLEDYGERLYRETESIDINGMEKTLGGFSVLMNTLREAAEQE